MPALWIGDKVEVEELGFEKAGVCVSKNKHNPSFHRNML